MKYLLIVLMDKERDKVALNVTIFGNYTAKINCMVDLTSICYTGCMCLYEN